MDRGRLAARLVALTKDVRIVRDHESALRSSTIRVFALDNANITGDEMAERYRRHLNRIVQRARKPGPYVYVVHVSALSDGGRYDFVVETLPRRDSRRLTGHN